MSGLRKIENKSLDYMKNALILHSIQGNPEENWLPWLKEELEKKGYAVTIPALPTPNKPNIETTWSLLKDSFDFNAETLLIGHSSGASLALGVLQRLPEGTRIKRTILAAAFTHDRLSPETWKFVKHWEYSSLFPREGWDFEKIRNSSSDFILFDSPSDPFVQMSHGNFLEKRLKAKHLTIEDAKHFSVFTGGEKWKKFPEILEYI